MAGVDTGLIKHEGYDSNGNPREIITGVTNKANHVGSVPVSNTPYMLYMLTGLTSVWPGDDSYSFTLPLQYDIRLVRIKAIKTSGTTSGAYVKVAMDLADAESAYETLSFVPSNQNTTPFGFIAAFDGEWTELESQILKEIPPFTRFDFLPTADTWDIFMEVR